jgi:hypothetical protein
MTNRVMVGLVCLASVLAIGCGKADVAIVKRPLLPIEVCENVPGKYGCRHEIDAGKLIGLSLAQAERFAAKHGFVVRRLAPIRANELPTMDLQPNRLDVECDGLSPGSIVTRFVQRG